MSMPPPTGPPVVPAGPGMPPTGQGAPPPDVQDEGWTRLSPRMLLVHPVRILWSMALPLLIALFAGTRGGGEGPPFWLFAALAGAVLAVIGGVVAWFITRYRITPEQLQLRTGLLSRRVLTAPLDRVRSVDIESTPIHRVLGLTKVNVGTGVDSSRIELDGLPRDQAAALRVDLLRRSQEVAGPGQEAPADPEGTAQPEAEQAPATPEQELARIDWGWLRYAPFSLSSLVVVAGAVGVIFQFGDDLPIDQVDVARDAWAWIVAQAVLTMVAGLALLIAVGWVLVSTASYVLNWWNLRLVREGNGNIRLTRGLLTTRSQTLERARVRGVSMGEPFLLRFVKGAELTALATGVGLGGQVKVLPPAPRGVVESVGHELLEERGPLTMTLVGHGPRARRRIHVSQQWGSLFTAALVAVPTFFVDWWWFATWPWWTPLAVLGALVLLNAVIAESAWRNLGHALSQDYLVVQTGAFVRTREALERAGIIGWVVHQSFFQRRLGLADLVATTAAGGEGLVAPNIPLELAVDLADRATPGMLEDLLA